MRALSSRMIRTALLVVVLFLVIPTGTGSSQERGSLAVERLRRAASSNLDLTWNSRTGTPSAIVGNIALAGLGLTPAASADRTAADVVGQLGDLLGVRRPAEELLATDRTADDLGMTHVTMEQRYHGVEVYNATVKVHFSPDGKTSTGLSSGFIPRIALADVRPRITADQALVQARKALPGGAPVSPTRLVVYPGLGRDDPGAQARLAWLVDLEDVAVPARNLYVVSATDGAIVDALSRLLNFDPALPNRDSRAVRLTQPPGAASLSAVDDRRFAAAAGATIGWPFDPSDGKWAIVNGYRGDADHGSGYAMFALDFAKCLPAKVNTVTGACQLDAGWATTTGATVRSPVDGTVAWPDDRCSGLSIDVNGAPGYRIALFHIEGYPTTVGQRVQRGQPIGQVSAKACQAGTIGDHIHMTLYIASAQDTPVSRTAVPFSGSFQIAGCDYTDDASQPSYNEHKGNLLPCALTAPTPPRPRKTYSALLAYVLPGVLKRSGDDAAVDDRDVDRAHDFVGAAYDYYKRVHNRDSFDNKGTTIVSSAHYGIAVKNAAWNGTQMLFGEGYAVRDVTGHELTHGVIESSARLEYRWQSGALNESFADIFGVLINQEVKPNDWLIGEDLPKADLAGHPALRSMSDPVSLGQPANTKDSKDSKGWRTGCSDNEMVHSNSGIFNKAFYNVATDTRVGKDKAAWIFYRALIVYLQPTSSFEDARAFALRATTDLYGSGTEYTAVREDFQKVGLDGTFSPPIKDCSCGVAVSLTAAPDGEAVLADLRSVRDTVFQQDPGRRWSDIYYKHQWELAGLLLANGEIRANAVDGLRAFDPIFRALLMSDSTQSDVILTPELIDAAEKALMGVAERGSAEMRDDIQREWRQATPRRFVGWRVGEVWKQLQLENSKRIVFPILARG